MRMLQTNCSCRFWHRQGSSSTLGVDSTLGGSRPGLGRRPEQKDLHLREDTSIAPADVLAKLQQPATTSSSAWEDAISRADEASFRADSASVRANTAASGFGSSQSNRGFRKLSKGSLERQGRQSRGTPMPPGYGHITRHLPRKATDARLSGSASQQTSPGARNEEDTQLRSRIPKCSGLDSLNKHTPALKVPLQTGLRFRSRGYEQPPYQGARGMTNSKLLTDNRPDSSGNDPRFGRRNSSSDDLRVDAAVTRPSPASPLEGRGQAIKAKESEARSAAGADGLVGRDNLLQLPPPQHRRQRPPARRRHAGEWRTPQPAPADPHSGPRGQAGLDLRTEASCRSEDKTIQEHERRPRSVRRLGRSTGARGTTDARAQIKRQEAASEAATEPAEPASQARWS
jgi:hypothetical protein